ncbi:MAG: NAD(P)/FAD-dependent oxidoreductase [Actinomycetota bacterium]
MRVDDLTAAEPATGALARQACAEREALGHPARSWTGPAPRPVDGPTGTEADDVLIVGAGQSGVVIAAGLQREGVHRVSVLDRAPAGEEGPWLTFARMRELRTPKELVGHEFGQPSLSLRSWFEARHGTEAWERVDRIPRTTWKAYLDWYATVTGVTIENETTVVDVRPAARSGTPAPAVAASLLAVDVEGPAGPVTRYARTVVLATGFDGAGEWRVPAFVSDALPADRYHHSNGPIDFAALAGRRIGILGHGASAFDNAIAALGAGAASVDLCFRRRRLPRVNPHRFLETGGVMTHYPSLSDETRWRVAHFFRSNDQPPPVPTFSRAMALDGFRLRPATPWSSVELGGDEIVVTTPHGEFRYDHLILATGAIVDLTARAELSSLAPVVARWADRFNPPIGLEDERLAALPYLGWGYGFEPGPAARASGGVGVEDAASEATAAWVRRVFAFNACSAVSHGPHSTSISGHRHALPRLIRGVTHRLLLDVEGDLIDDLSTYRSDDLPVADDFEDQFLPTTMGM